MKLKEPLMIRNLKLANRIVLPPMATAKSDKQGCVTDELIAYYRQRAEAGTGLIITEHAFICPQGKASPNQLSVSKEEDIPGLKRLADTIHACSNTQIIVQLNHAGSAARPDDPETPLLSASAVVKPGRKDPVLPEEMSEEDIRETVRYFTEAALRVREAGFDGIEVHSAHGYLLNQFYSPLTNKREDGYGKDLDGRLRIHKEVLRSIRNAVGDDFLVSVRLGGCDYTEGGSTISDAAYAAHILEENGTDLISLSGGFCGYRIADTSPGYFRDMSFAVKEQVSVPVLLTGGIRTPEEAEHLLETGAADLIGIGREMLTDADWSKKALAL